MLYIYIGRCISAAPLIGTAYYDQFFEQLQRQSLYDSIVERLWIQQQLPVIANKHNAGVLANYLKSVHNII